MIDRSVYSRFSIRSSQNTVLPSHIKIQTGVVADAVDDTDAANGSRSLASSGIAEPTAIDDKLLEEFDSGSSKI